MTTEEETLLGRLKEYPVQFGDIHLHKGDG